MPDEKTPEQRTAEAEIARHQAKLDAAPKGSRLAANTTLRIAVAKASLVADAAQSASLEKTARETHAATIAAITAAEAEEAEAARAAAVG